MLTEDQLAERLRTALAHHTTGIEPPPGLLAAVRAELAGAPPSSSRRRRRPAPSSVLIAGAAGLAVALAALAIALLGHGSRAAHPATAPPVAHIATSPHTSTAPGAGPATPEQVAAPLGLTLGPVARYCAGPGAILLPCRAGQHPASGPSRLVELTVRVPRAAGRGSWYAWTLTAPAACAQASAGGPTRGSVAPGTRLVFDALLPPGCRGRVKASVTYVTAAARSDSEQFTLIGRATALVP